VARIAPELLQKLKDRLGIGDAAVYARIQQRTNALMLDRPEAALALAAELNININKWASPEQRAKIAAARAGVAPSAVLAQPAEARPRARATSRRPSQHAPRGSSLKARGKKVFVVHGRNAKLNKAMFQFLRALQLQPIEWEKAVALTKKANPYIGEILARAFDEATAVVVLMTPDDEARLKKEFRNADDEAFESQLRGQPRPNVLFEAGFALSKYGDQTVLVAIGKLRPFSDIQGRHVARFDGSHAKRHALAMRLKSTGLDVDMEGSDWMSEGDFTI
jgi:predicted nucleotide-binding protein